MKGPERYATGTIYLTRTVVLEHLKEGARTLYRGFLSRDQHKALRCYLDELERRYNNRDNPFLFRDTLLKLIQSENLPYQEVVADGVSP